MSLNTHSDIIAAIATPNGHGGIGIVRVSGNNLSAFGGMLAAGALPKARHAAMARFIDTDAQMIDSGLAIYFPAPHSFTGEAVLELHAHGGPVVLQKLLARCLALGARPAEPGEFTLRAYLNNRIDLLQAEAVADIILADSEHAAQAAARSLRGDFSAAVAALDAQLKQCRWRLEGGLDFSDDDAGLPVAEDSAIDIRQLQQRVQQLLADAAEGARITRGIRAVIAGAPNVGKSSLFNRLCRAESAIVSDIPGTTRDVLEQQVRLDGVSVSLADGAGIRDADGNIEREGIRRIQARLSDADIILSVSTHDTPAVALGDTAAVVLSVRNKIDLHPGATGAPDDIAVSAKTGDGLDALRRAIALAHRAPAGALFSARERHLRILEQCESLITRAADDINAPELACAWLRDAQTALGTMIGHYDNEDLLGDIFSRFCIGK